MRKVKNALQDMSYERSPETFFKVFRAVVIFLLLAVITLTILIVRNNSHTNDKFAKNDVILAQRFETLSTDFKDLVRADCPFLRSVYMLPNYSAQRPPSDVTIQLSTNARDSYIGKGCAEQLGRDGKPLGPLPRLDSYSDNK